MAIHQINTLYVSFWRYPRWRSPCTGFLQQNHQLWWTSLDNVSGDPWSGRSDGVAMKSPGWFLRLSGNGRFYRICTCTDKRLTYTRLIATKNPLKTMWRRECWLYFWPLVGHAATCSNLKPADHCSSSLRSSVWGADRYPSSSVHLPAFQLTTHQEQYDCVIKAHTINPK